MTAQKIISNRYLIINFLHKCMRKLGYMNLKHFKVLDVGCGKKPYQIYFNNPQLYIGIDKNPVMGDVVAVAEALPFKNSYFDIILCTQVLEHLESPKKALNEINRVVQANGRLILSTHGFWIEEHEPADYWRWTLKGLTKILNECGFKIIECSSLEPTVSFFQTMLLFIPQKNIFIPLIASLNIIAILIQKIFKKKGPKLYVVHFVIAEAFKR